MTGYVIEYWPGTSLVKMVLAFEGDIVPEGWGFVKEGDPLPDPDPAPLTSEQLLTLARVERDRLLVYATLRINPLQDDVDNDESTPEGVVLLKLWKQYRSAVSKTETKPGWPENPQWPVPPVPLETTSSIDGQE